MANTYANSHGRKKRGSRWWHWLKRLFGALLVLVALLAVAGGWLLWQVRVQPLPQLDGEIALRNVQAPVDILRDELGVPHIFAENEADGAYAMGWVTAQDRLFQLFFFKYLSQGRLSEIAGAWEPVLRLGRLMQTLDLHGLGQRMLERSSPQTKEAITHFYRGVNDYIAQTPELPFAVRLLTWLGVELHLEDDDLLGMVGVMALRLNSSWRNDMLYTRLAAKLGQEKAQSLFPLSNGGRPAIYPTPAAGVQEASSSTFPSTSPSSSSLSPLPVPSPGVQPNEEHAEALVRTLQAWEDHWQQALSWLPGLAGPTQSASNNWAIHGTKTQSGLPILATDPHLGLGLPDTWYMVHLKTPQREIAGITLPGVPFIVMGHNTHIAWGMTNIAADAGDFFIERTRPGPQENVQYRGQWVPIEQRNITLKGWWETHEYTIRYTPHGPIVNDLLAPEVFADLDAVPTLAYSWGYLHDPRANEIEGLFQLSFAQDWEAFRTATDHFSGVLQHVAYADRHGHIGLAAVGRIPKLPDGDGKRLRQGWDGSDEWQGFIPFDAMPKLFDPPRGWVASANNATYAPPAPQYISSYNEPGERFTRISTLLEQDDAATLDTMAALQLDTFSPYGMHLREQLLAALEASPSAHPAATAAQNALRRWDGHFDKTKRGATIIAHLIDRLHYALFEDELTPELTKAYRSYSAMAKQVEILSDPQSPWIDDQSTPTRETLPDILKRTFEEVLTIVVETAGEDPQNWTWGKRQELQLKHPLGYLPLFGSGYRLGPQAMPGHQLTVNRMSAAPPEQEGEKWRVFQGASARLLVDFADLDATRIIIPTGQSGIPDSPHFGDGFARYVQGEYHILPHSRQAVEDAARNRLLLLPQP